MIYSPRNLKFDFWYVTFVRLSVIITIGAPICRALAGQEVLIQMHVVQQAGLWSGRVEMAAPLGAVGEGGDYISSLVPP